MRTKLEKYMDMVAKNRARSIDKWLAAVIETITHSRIKTKQEFMTAGLVLKKQFYNLEISMTPEGELYQYVYDPPDKPKKILATLLIPKYENITNS